MPSVQRHEGVEEWLYDSARTFLSRRRDGVHVSDLISPRKAYWAGVRPKPPTDREIGFFLAGRAHEEALARASELGRHRKVKGKWEGIEYEIDAFAIDDSGVEIPVEVKTNRKPTILEPEQVVEEYDLAVAQLGSYAAIKTPVGSMATAYLIEFHLYARNLTPEGEVENELTIKQSQPKLVVYQIDWSDVELETIRGWMRLRRDMLIEAQAKRDHTILPECHQWMCGKEEVFYDDPYCPRCKTVYIVGEIRPDGKKRGVMKKCETCKDGKERVALTRPSKTVFLPTCRWFFDCLPAQWATYHPRGALVDTGQDSV